MQYVLAVSWTVAKLSLRRSEMFIAPDHVKNRPLKKGRELWVTCHIVELLTLDLVLILKLLHSVSEFSYEIGSVFSR